MQVKDLLRQQKTYSDTSHCRVHGLSWRCPYVADKTFGVGRDMGQILTYDVATANVRKLLDGQPGSLRFLLRLSYLHMIPTVFNVHG